jgi:hypothetical protein
MRPIHQLAPAHARFIHDLMIIKTRINVNLLLPAGRKAVLRRWNRRASPLLSLLDKRNAAVNYSVSR